MLGWDVLVFKRSKVEGKADKLAAKWSSGALGLDWLDELVEQKKAACLLGSGYPNYYFIHAGTLLPILTKGLPAHNTPLVIGDDYVLPPNWTTEIEWDREVVLSCEQGDLLIIEAWDQS